MVTGVEDADHVLAFLVITATFHLNIDFYENHSKSNCLNIDQKPYQVLLDPGAGDLVGRIVGTSGGLLPGQQSHLVFLV